MIGRRATVGLSLLCALLFSAFAVQSASATAGTNITAFTCANVGAGHAFADAHCDNKTGGGYEHVAINVGTSTEIEASNETTGGATSPMTLKGKPFNVNTSITCATLVGAGTVENSEPSALVHKLTGAGTLNYTNCEVKEPKKCAVAEPIVATIGSVESQEGLTGPNGEANAMGLEFKPAAGSPLTTITLLGAECALKNVPIALEGSVTATSGPGVAEPQTNKWSGATAVVTAAMSNLSFAGKAATYTGIATVKMKAAGNPITSTTVT